KFGGRRGQLFIVDIVLTSCHPEQLYIRSHLEKEFSFNNSNQQPRRPRATIKQATYKAFLSFNIIQTLEIDFFFFSLFFHRYHTTSTHNQYGAKNRCLLPMDQGR
ncbi:hypothetical protein TGAM01_v207132, partial [Trichoderma gamsii]